MNYAEKCREMANMASTQIQVPTKEQVYNTPDPQLFPSLISPSVIHIEFHISFFLSLYLSFSLSSCSSYPLFFMYFQFNGCSPNVISYSVYCLLWSVYQGSYLKYTSKL